MAEAPESREALLGLLAEMARGETTAEQLRAAREGIRGGLLGPPSEISVRGDDGRARPLLAWAASWNDLEMVTLLLEQGASPLEVGEDGRSVLRAAHPWASEPGGGELFHLVRRAAREASEQTPNRLSGLGTRALERPYAVRTDRTIRALRSAVRETKRLDVLLVEHDVKSTVRALANLVQSPRREADVASRPVGDAERLAFVYRLEGIDWTIVPFVFEPTSPWNVETVTELAARGDGIAPLARALAAEVESRVVHLKYDEYTAYAAHGGIETRAFEVDELWAASDGPLPSQAEAEALLPDYDGEPAGILEAAAHRRERLRRIDEMMGELGVLVPPMIVKTDGYNVQLDLFGVVPTDVERVDLVVLQELGDPAVDRRPKAPAAAPAVVVAGQPVLAHAPPPVVAEPSPEAEPGPALSDAPPLVHEPPPLIAEPALTANEPPPMSHAPPPVVTVPVAENEPPPIADEPDAESEPPETSVADDPGPPKSEAPPLVRAPPPIVTAPAAPNAAEASAEDDAEPEP